MIVALTFGGKHRIDGRDIREAGFAARSTIPLSALCVVANGMREHLRRLLGAAIDVTVGEATPLCDNARECLAVRTHCFLTRGRTSDVLLFINELDARRLLAFAFGEKDGRRQLSPLECSALGRLVHELALLLDPLCAERQASPSPVDAKQIARCVTYVDMRIGAPVDAVLGIGLTHEPPADQIGPTISADQLLGVECEVRAEIARGSMTAERLAYLAPGEMVRMDTKVGAEAMLKVAGLVIARGRGGIVVDEDALPTGTAFAVDAI